MKSELWYGYLHEANGRGSIVVFDHDMQDLPDDEVYLFNARDNSIVPYKKDVVRPKLRLLKNPEKSRLKSVESAFRKAKYRLQVEIEEQERAFFSLLDNDYEPYIDTEHLKQQVDIAEELRMYSELLSKSRDEGWFYPDLDGTLLDKLVDSS